MVKTEKYRNIRFTKNVTHRVKKALYNYHIIGMFGMINVWQIAELKVVANG